MNLALAYYKAAEISQAAAELERVLEQQRDRQPVLLLADCYLRLGENKKVIDLLAPLQQATPDDKALDYLLGTALIRDGQAAAGQLLVDRVVRDGDSAEGRLLLGESKLMANDFAGALEEFKKGLQINPQLPGLNGYYGIALAYAGDNPEAEAAYRKELASNPNDYSANFQLGKLLKGDENYAESRRCFERALSLRPHDPPVRYQLALLDLEDGQAEQARVKLESLIRENPRDVEAHISLATAYYRLKRKADGNRQRAIVLQLNAERPPPCPEGCRNEAGLPALLFLPFLAAAASGDAACAACHAQQTSHFREPHRWRRRSRRVELCDILKKHPDLQFQEGPTTPKSSARATAACLPSPEGAETLQCPTPVGMGPRKGRPDLRLPVRRGDVRKPRQFL